MRFLEDIVEKLVVKRECVVIGDFNIDLMIDLFYKKITNSNVKFRHETVC